MQFKYSKNFKNSLFVNSQFISEEKISFKSIKIKKIKFSFPYPLKEKSCYASVLFVFYLKKIIKNFIYCYQLNLYNIMKTAEDIFDRC